MALIHDCSYTCYSWPSSQPFSWPSSVDNCVRRMEKAEAIYSLEGKSEEARREVRKSEAYRVDVGGLEWKSVVNSE